MTYKPIPEHRRRQLGKLIPELTRKFKSWRVAPASGEPEHAFWNRELPPGSPEELVWVIRHTRGAAGFMDPARKRGYDWPGRCARTGYFAVCDSWPLDPIPDEPQAQPTPEGPLVDGTPVKEGDVLYYVGGYKPFVGAQIIAGKPKSKTRVWVEGFYCLDGRWIDPGTMHAKSLSRTKPVTATQALMSEQNRIMRDRIIASQMEAFRLAFDRKPVKPEAFNFDLETMRPGQIAFDRKPVSRKFFDPAVLSTSTKEKHTMNQAPSAAQATPFNHAMLTVDTSNIVEVKTFVYGRDIATLDDDTLFNYVQSLTGAIEYLEALNFKTPLAKLVTKIAQLQYAKAKIVDLLGGAPVEQASPAIDAEETKPKRVRRTKAEMEAGAQGGTTPQAQSKSIPPAPPAPTQPEPSVADVDLDD